MGRLFCSASGTTAQGWLEISWVKPLQHELGNHACIPSQESTEADKREMHMLSDHFTASKACWGSDVKSRYSSTLKIASGAKDRVGGKKEAVFFQPSFPVNNAEHLKNIQCQERGLLRYIYGQGAERRGSDP